jgi:SAM-dependent methyltransferase
MTRDSNLFEKVINIVKDVRDKRRIDNRPDLHDFWRQPAPDGNAPTAYIDQVHRSRALLKLIGDLPKDARILEVGCNVGRNLAFLHDNGYPNVVGVEINPHAVKILRETYPQLADAEIHVGAAEEALVSFEDNSVDLVFTMAVLEHIHPESTEVFSNIARIAKTLLTIEPERHASHRQYPHDVRAIFQKLGFELVHSTSMKDIEETAQDGAISEYFAWYFNKR